MSFHAVVQPTRIRLYDPEAEVTVQRIVAYRGHCRCGWAGPSRKSFAVARVDAADHTKTEHP